MQRRARRPQISLDWFDPSVVEVASSAPTWVDLLGAPASPPPLNRLPTPDEVLSGAAAPDFAGLRLRSPDTFRCGILHHFKHQWDSFMTGVKGYDVVRPWIHKGVHIPDFFQHYKGEFNGRSFDSVTPPPNVFSERYGCSEFSGFCG